MNLSEKSKSFGNEWLRRQDAWKRVEPSLTALATKTGAYAVFVENPQLFPLQKIDRFA
jgi:hypothetical protein